MLYLYQLKSFPVAKTNCRKCSTLAWHILLNLVKQQLLSYPPTPFALSLFLPISPANIHGKKNGKSKNKQRSTADLGGW